MSTPLTSHDGLAQELPPQAMALPPQIMAQIRGIQLRSQRLVTDTMAGRYTSAFKGRGMQFEEVRAYAPGDDVRHIDWNQTARHGGAFVKEFRQERELTVMLLVDVSGSTVFGSAGRLKSEISAELAALLAHLACQNQDRVGLVLFSDRIEATLAPRRGRAHIWRVIRDILTFAPASRGARGTRLRVAWDMLSQQAPRGAICFVISDFLDPQVEEGMGAAAARCDVTAVRVSDPHEEKLPAVGMVALEDCESGAQVWVDTLDPVAMRAVSEAARQRRQHFLHAAGRARMGTCEVDTPAHHLPLLLRYLRQRQRRQRGR